MAIVLALVHRLSTSLGGVFALRNRDRLHLVLGFTAGVLLGLVAFDLLPEVFDLGGNLRFLGLPAVSFGLAFGFLLLHVVERTLALHHAHEGEYSAHNHPEVGLASADRPGRCTRSSTASGSAWPSRSTARSGSRWRSR